MFVFGITKKSTPATQKKWGDTESQRKLDRRIEAYRARFTKADIASSEHVENELQLLKENCDEDGVRNLVEQAERAITIVERVARGGQELREYMQNEVESGRLQGGGEKAHSSAIDTFFRLKRENIEKERRKLQEKEEPARRQKEVERLSLRIKQLPLPLRTPLQQQLAQVSLASTSRDFRKAIYDIERAISDIEE